MNTQQTSLSPEEQQALAAGYILGDLEPDEALVVETLVNTDPAFAQMLEQLQASLELAYAPALSQPSSRLRASILGAQTLPDLGQEAQATSEVDSIRSASRFFGRGEAKPHSRRFWQVGLGAVAAVMILGLGTSNYQLRQSLQRSQTRASTAELITVSLTPGENSTAGPVTLTLDLTNLEAQLQEKLPPLPAGQVYAVWTVLQPDAPFTTDEKSAILTHTFTGEESQTQSIALPAAYRAPGVVRAIAVTIEDASAPQRHVASPILIQPVML